jgi:hypothetical protein
MTIGDVMDEMRISEFRANCLAVPELSYPGKLGTTDSPRTETAQKEKNDVHYD